MKELLMIRREISRENFTKIFICSILIHDFYKNICSGDSVIITLKKNETPGVVFLLIYVQSNDNYFE